MTYLCRNCCKMLCKNRDSLQECNDKITFLQAGILDQPKKIERNEDNENME